MYIIERESFPALIPSSQEKYIRAISFESFQLCNELFVPIIYESYMHTCLIRISGYDHMSNKYVYRSSMYPSIARPERINKRISEAGQCKHVLV